MTGTDLPVPLGGTGGRHDEDAAHGPRSLLDRALDCVPAPPLHTVSVSETYRWSADVEAQLVSRRAQRRLARAVERGLRDERRTALHLERDRRTLERRAVVESQKAAGTYWPARERARASQRSARVDVDPAAWRRAKQAALLAAMTLGEYVGSLVVSVAGRGGGRTLELLQRYGRRGSAGAGRRAQLQTRLAVPDDEAWAQVRAAATALDVSVARYIGLVVEAAHPVATPARPAAVDRPMPSRRSGPS
ncbi:MAG: hypothetical protein IT195_10420 [Microthrixaceae bacterium]|nr:hypothetical protein [Microthrixaceae bacterium]